MPKTFKKVKAVQFYFERIVWKMSKLHNFTARELFRKSRAVPKTPYVFGKIIEKTLISPTRPNKHKRLADSMLLTRYAQRKTSQKTNKPGTAQVGAQLKVQKSKKIEYAKGHKC